MEWLSGLLTLFKSWFIFSSLNKAFCKYVFLLLLLLLIVLLLLLFFFFLFFVVVVLLLPLYMLSYLFTCSALYPVPFASLSTVSPYLFLALFFLFYSCPKELEHTTSMFLDVSFLKRAQPPQISLLHPDFDSNNILHGIQINGYKQKTYKPNYFINLHKMR